MSSKKRIEPLDSFEAGFQVTAEESLAQWRVRERDWLRPPEYIEWCSHLTRGLPASRDEIASPIHAPFKLD